MLDSPRILLLPIFVPLVLGIFSLLVPRRLKWVREVITLVGIASVLTISAGILGSGRIEYRGFILLDWEGMRIAFDLLSYHFSSLMLLGSAFFGLLISLYSIRAVEENPRAGEYYAYLLFTLSAVAGSFLSDNLVIFLLFWGALAVLLYLLIGLGSPGSERAAMKALLMVGGSDVIMLFGAGIIFYLAGTLQMSQLVLPLDGWLSYAAFLCLLIGALTKVGVMPFHTWIPDSADAAPVSVMAFLPASVDKLLGIYLLSRVCLDFFHLTPVSPMSILLMSVGSVTIIAGVGMALVQKDFLKLLSFHTVSQAGYMVLGIGTGLPMGIMGGLFHMLNNSVYKNCLFLCAGSVKHRTNTTHLDRLGGLASVMPITFFGCLLAAMAISGIPPLNGFFSKWMIYQGVVELGKQSGASWVFPIFLTVAAFGSVLTLASFLKTLHSVFLGGPSRAVLKTIEAGPSMWLPFSILAGLSVAMGIFARFTLNHLLVPIVGGETAPISDLWTPSLATMLIIAGPGVGALIYLLVGVTRVRVSPSFVGGESSKYETGRMISIHLYPKSNDDGELIGGTFDYEGMKIPGSHFYDSIRTIAILREMYQIAEKGFFDLYQQISRPFVSAIGALKRLHDGILPNYIGWYLLGAAVVIFLILALYLQPV